MDPKPLLNLGAKDPLSASQGLVRFLGPNAQALTVTRRLLYVFEQFSYPDLPLLRHMPGDLRGENCQKTFSDDTTTVSNP